MSAPRTGACEPWVTSEQVQATAWSQQAINHAKLESAKPNAGFVLSDDQINAICADAAVVATDLLYRLSGKQFTGECGPVTIRPVARPVNADSRGWINRNWSYGGYGSASMMTMRTPPVTSQFGENYPPLITLHDYPVREIVEVKIDGVVIPPEEYELREFQQLVRIRPTVSSVPTERWGWPTSQTEDLPDTQQGTFSVTYIHGADPGAAGRASCLKLAEAIALPQLGDSTRYPTRVSSFTRQGVSAQTASVVDVMKDGGTGIYEVDLWLMTVNPTKARRQAVVWSPDQAPNRRTASR